MDHPDNPGNKVTSAPRGIPRVLLAGQPGHGKSALAAALADGARRVVIEPTGPVELLAEIIAADAAAALMVLDAEAGIDPEFRRHGHLLHLFKIRPIVVAVNAMDRVGYGRDAFEAIARDCAACLEQAGLTAAHLIPVSADRGDNIAQPSVAMDWYQGPTLAAALDGLQAAAQPTHLPLRLPVGHVRAAGQGQEITGQMETGVLAVGDQLLFSPANRTARVKTIAAAAGAPLERAAAGDSIVLTLEGEIDVTPGQMASHEADPPIESDVFRARLFWLGAGAMGAGASYTMRLNALEAGVAVQSIEQVTDPTDPAAGAQQAVAAGQVAEVILRAEGMLALDAFADSPRTGRFLLLDGGEIVAGGTISMQGYADQRHLITRRSTNIQRVEHDVTQENREQRNGHQGGVLWFTGLSGSGKSTVAVAVERRLFALGYQTYVLDGDNVRHGLNGDLGFSPEDRAENIRRIGEVAALISRAGLICITAFISPYRSDRDRARRAGADQFAEIYIKADLATCEGRDPKGLYKKARAGEIPDFTGISAPYEAPENPELVVDTSALSIEETVDRVVAYVQDRFGLETKLAG